MGDIPGFIASEFPEDARRVPGQAAFTARQQADAEDVDADSEVDEKRIFYKEDEAPLEGEASDDQAAGQTSDESTYGDADL